MPLANPSSKITIIHLITVSLFSLDLLIWGVVAAWEGNTPIFAIHALMLACAALILILFSKRATFVFAIGLILRSLFTMLAWYTAFNEERRFYIGTNSDASRFWDVSQMSYQEASLWFEDPLMPRLIVLISQLSEFTGDPHYLAATQPILMAGALMVVFAYLFIRQNYNERVGAITAMLLAISPTAITFSTGLMRDSLIGLFGLVMLWALSRIRNRESIGLMLLFSISSLVALAYLRSISMAAFVIAGIILLMSGTPQRPDSTKLRVKVLVLMVLGALLTYAIVDRFDRFDDALLYAAKVRAGEGDIVGMELNQNGLTTRIGEISPALFALISPISLMQPIPFYNWEAPYYIGGPPALMDVVLGFGGLFNQVLFGFYILGIRHWLLTRDSLGYRLGLIYVLFTCTIVMVGLGQIRMVMAHAFIFFYLGIAIAFDKLLSNEPAAILSNLIMWLGILSGAYLAYFLYQEGWGLFPMILMMITSIFVLKKLWLKYSTKKVGKKNPQDYISNKFCCNDSLKVR